jgi:hypothetical protein
MSKSSFFSRSFQRRDDDPLIDNIHQPLVECKVWGAMNHPDFKYPETNPLEYPDISDKVDVGIAFSGGGVRAALQAHGYIRALHQLGLLNKMKYMSCSSGGSWAGTVFNYSDVPLNDLLGPYIHPSACTLDVFSHVGENSFEQILMNSKFVNSSLKEIATAARSGDARDLWTRMIGNAFLTPYGLNRPLLLPCLPENVARMREVYQQVGADVITSRPDFPFTIINGSINVGGEAIFLPVEFTPLYYSVPLQYNLTDTKVTPVLGTIGGFICEPHGFTSSVSPNQMTDVWCDMADNPDRYRGCTLTKIPIPNKVISISECTGISSNTFNTSIATWSPAVIYDNIQHPLFNYWNPYTEYSGSLRYSDAGGFDTTTVLSLIRRGVTKIIACLSVQGDIDEGNQDSNMYAMAGLFGRAVLDKPEHVIYGFKTAEFNKLRRVFHPSAWTELVAGLQRNYRLGLPATYTLKTRVQPNNLIGIEGNYDVTLFVVVNANSSGWRGAIPQSLSEQIDRDHKRDPFEGLLPGVANDRFPRAFSTRMAYSPVLVNAYSQIATWALLENTQTLLELFRQE